ncbi:MAG: hypothetical protein Q9160_008783 [Pyrenula sp. 1 TL-2023]
MSGLELIGGISALISIIDASIKIYKGAKKDLKLSETFNTVGRRLPSLSDTLQTCKQFLESIHDSLAADVCEALDKIIESCDESAEKLRRIFEKVIPGVDDAWEKRYLKVAKSLGKGGKVEELMIAITQDVQLLANHHAVKSANQEQDAELGNIIKEMKSVKSSIPEEDNPGMNFNSGGGAQTNNINSGSGQFIANNAPITTQNFGRKSQLAIEYAHQIYDRDPNTWIIWIHASNADRFEQSFREVADNLKLAGRQDPKVNIFRLLSTWLSDKRNGPWMLVLNNLDNAEYLRSSLASHRTDYDSREQSAAQPLIDYLPQSRHGSILITTRSRDAARKLVEDGDIVPVEPLETSEGVMLLEKKLGESINKSQVEQLAVALELIPLALVQAAVYISQRAPRSSVEQYLKQYQKSDRSKSSLLNCEGGQLRRDHEARNSIITTWEISFNCIREIRPSAANLLSLMSFFDPQGILDLLLHVKADGKNERHRQGIRTLQDDFRAEEDKEEEEEEEEEEEGQSDLNEDNEFEEDVKTLRDYALIDINSDGVTFKMHALVQFATRKWLEIRKELEEWKGQFVQSLYRAFPQTGEHENWHECQILFPHVKSAARQRPAMKEPLEEWASLLHKAAWYTWSRGQGADTEEMSNTSFKVRKKVLGLEHEDTLTSLAMTALAYSLQGRWKEAEELEVQIMETRKRVLGEEHPDTLTSQANLAWTFQSQGRTLEAIDLMRQSIQISVRKLGKEHPDTLDRNRALRAWIAETGTTIKK